MSNWLQILIGFIPVCVILAVLIFVGKKMRVQWIISFVLVAAIGTGAAILSESDIVLGNGKRTSKKDSSDQEIVYAEPEDFLAVAYSFMNRGYLDPAEQVLDDYLDKCSYSDEYLLAAARLSVMRGDVSAAAGLYKIIDKVASVPSLYALGSDEKELVSAAAGNKSDRSAFNKACAEIAEIVQGIHDKANQEIRVLVDTYIYVDTNSDGWKNLSRDEKSKIAEELQSNLKSLRESGIGQRLLTIEVLQDTAVKVDVMSGEYDAAVNALDTNMTVENLITTAELVRRGGVSASTLKELEFFKQRKNENDIVKEWAAEQMAGGVYSQEEQDVINDILSELSDEFGDLDLSNASSLIEKMILSYALEFSDSEISKLYLELARIKFSENDTAKAALYLNTALGYAADSKDARYSGAARALIKIIRDPNNTEARKDIGKYTAIMMERLAANGIESVMPDEIISGSGEHGDDPYDSEGQSPSGGNGYGGASSEGSENDPSQDVSFDQYFTDTLNQSTGSVDIISVDASRFETVEAVITVDENLASGAEEFRENFNLLDCNIILSDYEIEKIEYTDINLMLVCDNSGSMSGQKIEDLKAALKSFANSSDEMDIAIIPFSDSVNKSNIVVFGSSASAITACIEKMNASGGTDIYSAVKEGLRMMPSSRNALNILVLMSDGQDSVPSANRMEELLNLCRDSNTSIYSMGLGSDVDSGVMRNYSDIGGGTYMYVSDSNSLLSFYNYIYKLCTNRYRVKYTAPDTTKVNRSLEVESTGTVYVNDIYNYSLYENDITEDNLGDDYTVNVDGVVFSGLENRILYRSSLEQTTYLLGSGFDEDASISVEISSGIKYSLKAEYVDSTRIKLTVPGEASCGIYDVYITYNDKRTVFSMGLVVTARDRHVIRFGDYVFTATELSETDNVMELGGIVEMNDWFGFIDGLTITGDTENDYSVSLSYKKAYIQYTDNGTCKGLAQYFAKHGYTFTVPGVNGHIIYNDPTVSPSSDEYPTKAYPFAGGAKIRVVDFINIDTPGMSLYPDRLVIDFQQFTMNLPFADKILKKVTGSDDLFGFKMEHSETLIFKNDEIGCKFSFSLGDTDEDYMPGKLGNMNLYFRKGSFKVDVDTFKGSVTLEAGVDIAFLSDGLSAKIVVEDWKIDEIEVGADYKINTYIGNVPVTFSDFKVGVSELGRINYDDPEIVVLGKILGSTWKGSFDCSMAKISAVHPGLEKYLKDAAIAKLDDTTIEFCLRKFYFSVSTKLNILGIMDFGKAKLELGMNIPYTNLVLGMDNESVSGIVADLTAGPMIDTDNFDLTFTGGVKIALTTGVVGVTVSGDLDVTVEWWIFVKDFSAKGEAFVGAYKTHSGKWQFAVYAMGTTSGGKSMKPVCFPHNALNSVSL